jgi:hypothetical protein
MDGNGFEQPMIPMIIAVAVLLLGIAVLFFFPYREVTQPPGKGQAVWEVLFPGTSPVWHVFGGLVLIAWAYLVIQDLILIFVGTPYMLSGVSMPNLSKAYGVPGAAGQNAVRLINPSWVWVYLPPAVLFAVNLILVLRARRRV